VEERTPRRAEPVGDDDDRVGAAGGDQRSLVGRRAELAELLGRLDAAVDGHGGLLLLAGEPGIGKTRLADEFASRAQAAGFRVAFGRSWEAGGAPAYWPWIQSLRPLVHGIEPDRLASSVGAGGPHLAQLLPELRDTLPNLAEPDPASPEVARFRLFDAVAGFVVRVAADRPLLIILEDLHAADDSSLLLLQFAAAELSGSCVLVLGTYREVELTLGPLGALLPDIARGPGTDRIALSGLSVDDVARFIESITGQAPPEALATAMHRDTNGNPLFIGEVVRLLVAEDLLGRPPSDGRWPIPEGVREVIGRRLERLSEGCRSVLRLGAVVGRDFTVEVIERLAGRPAAQVLEDLRDAAGARLIGRVLDDPGRFQFAHALVRDTLYDELAPADHVRLHRAVGEALETLYAADPEPHVAELAYHFLEAAPGGETSKGTDYAVAAGSRAVRLLAYEEAVRLLDMAHRSLRESPDERRRCEVLLLLGDAQERAGATLDSKASFLEAAELATRLASPELLGRAALGYAGRSPWLRAGADRQMIPLLTQALEALGDQDSVLVALLLGRLAGALRDQPTQEPRAKLAHRAVAMARRLGDLDTLFYALQTEWAATLLGPDGADQQLVVGEELNRLAAQVQDRERLNDSSWVHVVSSMTRGEVWEARRHLEAMIRFADESRLPAHGWYAGVVTTVLALQDGRFADADELMAGTLDLGRDARAWEAEASHLFARFVLRREQGRIAELEPDLRRALVTHPGYRSLRCIILVMLCDTGRLGEAKALFDQLARDDFAAFPRDNEWLFALTLLAEAAVVLGERDHAEVLYEQLSSYAHLVALAASEVSIGPVDRPLGLLAALLGREDVAAAHFTAAIRKAQRMGSPPWVAHAQLAYGEMLVERGPAAPDRHRADQLLASALEIGEELGMEALGSRVTAALAKLGPTRRPPPMSGGSRTAVPPTGETRLTPREREVVDLLAEGLSNRQVAERLHVSERTAEAHVQHILTKLGFTSRAQVASWAVRRELYADPDP
jgi:DNA-binding CsgD family transcriptional regulator/tetratricopeptide (TPR) repeat protein